MGHLGVSLPYCFGAKLVAPNRQVCAISGDGSIMINIQELETAKRYNMPFICVVANNSCWGMIKSGQKFGYKKRFIDVDFTPTSFGTIAKGFGCYGEQVTDPAEIRPALQRAKDSKLPAIVDVVIKFTTPDTTKLGVSIGML